MNPLSKIIDQKQEDLKRSNPISQNSFDLWINNECTKRLFAELEIDILEAFLAMTESNAKESRAGSHALSEVINWKPQELDTNE